MSNRGACTTNVRERMPKPRRTLSRRRRFVYVGASLAALAVAGAGFTLLFGSALINRYAKGRIEETFARTHPGSVLRIGELVWAVTANRLTAHSVRLTTTNATCSAGTLSLTGVRWLPLLSGTASPDEVLALASLAATNLAAELPQSHYRIHCASLSASVPLSDLTAVGTELQPSIADDARFAAHPFRMTRFSVILPECKVTGLAWDALLRGTAYRATSVEFQQPLLDALVNSDKPLAPFVERPLMVHEALAALGLPFRVDRLSITNACIRYSERVAAGAQPGVLTFTEVNLSANGIANRGDPAAAILVQAQGNLMDAGTLKIQMSIPITPPTFSLHYSGSLSAMDLTRLGPFLDITTHVRIASGNVQAAAFEIDVIAGQARGQVTAVYGDLKIAVLNKETGTPKALASFLANVLKVRNANSPNVAYPMKRGKVSYTRNPQDEFLEFAWLGMRSGVLDVISH